MLHAKRLHLNGTAGSSWAVQKAIDIFQRRFPGIERRRAIFKKRLQSFEGMLTSVGLGVVERATEAVHFVGMSHGRTK